MTKTSLYFLQTHIKKMCAINELSPQLSDATIKFNGDVIAYNLFLETVEQVPVAISITDKKAKILYVNKEFTAVTGYQPDDILGQNESILSDKRTPKTVYHELWHTIRNQKVWRGILCNRHKSGHRYIADLTIAPILNEANEITYYIGMHRDITQTHEAEKNVINQKLLIESVINASPIAMVVLDAQDHVILDNHNYKALVSDLDKGEPAAFFLTLLRNEMGEHWTQLQTDKQGFNHYEFKIEDKNGRRARWFSCAGNWFLENDIHVDAFFDQSAKHYLILTITDITRQRRQLEALHIQTLKTLMTEDERVRSIRETLLGAIHQIQMPMNQIKAAEQILKHKGTEQNSGLLNILQQIQTSGEEAIATMQHCLPNILHITEAPVNLNQILHEVLLLNSQRLLNNGIDVHWQPLAVLPHIMGSANRLRMLFNQLLDNAITAVSAPYSGEQYIKISTHLTPELIHVCIDDSGPGIPVDKHSKVFEPFYTSNATGTHKVGMGLVIAKEIVTQHHGFIDIDQHYYQGCRFKISFPLPPHELGEETL